MVEDTDGWHARLTLGFSAKRAGKTVLDLRQHEGPIVVQRPLYPEGPQVCHVAILHPPGGIAGGDRIDADINVGANAHVTITTPGATRWYKANAREASQTVRVRVARDGRLDWLPLENLFFEDTDAVCRSEFDLESGAAAIGWDVYQFGRVTTSTYWNRGRVRTGTRIKIDGELLWVDRGQVSASDDVRASATGLDNFPSCGTLWCFGASMDASPTEELASLMPWEGHLRAGVTTIPYDAQQSLYLVRSVAVHVEDIMALMIKVWTFLRLRVLQTAAVPLRLWAT